MAAETLQGPSREPRLTIHEDAPAGGRARLSGVSPRRAAPATPTPPPPVGKAAIFAAIQPGTRRCRGQREYRRRGFELISGQPWNAQRKAHYAAIFKRLSAFMDWHDRTARPTHEVLRGPHRPGCPGSHKPTCRRPLDGCRCGERCGCPGRLSSDTVGRAVAAFAELGLLGVVSAGVRADMRPWLHAHEGNLAAVYVCTVPRRRKHQAPCVVAGQGGIADLSGFRRKPDRAPCAREHPKTKAARAARGLILLPRGGTGLLRAVPGNRTEGLAAAAVIQDRCVWLRELPPGRVYRLARPYWACARPWTVGDVLHALDHSASQVRADRAAVDRAAQQAWRRDRAAAAGRAVDAAAAGLGDAARAAIAAASPAAERALARARALAQRDARPVPGAAAPGTPPEPFAPDGAPIDVAALRQALLARLDANGLLHAQRHRVKTAQRIAGPAEARRVAADTARAIAAAQLAEATNDR